MRHLMLLLLFVFGCETQFTAHVHEAEALAPGSRVMMAGVDVGEVKSVGVVGGDAPVAVAFTAGDASDALAQGACAAVNGDQLEVRSSDQPVVDDTLQPCPADVGDLLQGARELLHGAAEAVGNTEGLSREAGRLMGESLREAAGGLREGIGDDGARELGRALGEAAREIGEGAQEGAQQPSTMNTP